MGDVVFELLVRERFVLKGDAPVNKLHNNAIKYVSAVSQSKAVELIIDKLTQAEIDIFKRGRNSGGNVPKSSTPYEYRRATGLEALFGYLYLNGETNRINELFEIIWNSSEQFKAENEKNF